jgi:hypothetical protein
MCPENNMSETNPTRTYRTRWTYWLGVILPTFLAAIAVSIGTVYIPGLSEDMHEIVLRFATAIGFGLWAWRLCLPTAMARVVIDDNGLRWRMGL